MPNWEKGLRCTEDSDGTLWVNRSKSGQLFKDFFPDLDIDKIKAVLFKLMKRRCGAFWIDPKNKKVIAEIGDSHANLTAEASYK